MKPPEKNNAVNSTWPQTQYKQVDRILRFLLDRSGSCAFHGAHEDWPELYSSLDLKLKDPSMTASKLLRTESALLEDFGKQCFRHLIPKARMHVEFARLKWKTFRTTGTMFAGRHYGLPTRCIDWTSNSLAALFFACRRSPSKDGVVWWMHKQQFESALKPQWPKFYRKCADIVDDFESRFTKNEEHDVLLPLIFPRWMPRTIAQDSFMTLAGQLGIDHAKKMYELGVRDCGRLLIPKDLKDNVLTKLDQIGVNGYTLEVGDSTVETVSTDIARTRFPCTSN